TGRESAVGLPLALARIDSTGGALPSQPAKLLDPFAADTVLVLSKGTDARRTQPTWSTSRQDLASGHRLGTLSASRFWAPGRRRAGNDFALADSSRRTCERRDSLAGREDCLSPRLALARGAAAYNAMSINHVMPPVAG